MAKNFEVLFSRHGNSPYGNYNDVLASETPNVAFDSEKQRPGDLTEAGIALARERARELLSNLNPDLDSLVFFTSNEARAVETARIFLEDAHAMGFEVIRPKHAGSAFVEEAAGGEVRALDALSLNSENVLVTELFNSEKDVSQDINWEALDEDTKRKWHAAQAIVCADDRGSWGANFRAHSEAVKRIFPKMESAQDLFDGKFKKLLKWIRWGKKKTQENQSEKNVKILAFGHENYLMVALQELFGEEGIGNCETIKVGVEEDAIEIDYRGKHSRIL